MQLQNGLPAFRPFLATIFRMGFPHFGHFGAPSAACRASRRSNLALLMRSVKPPSSVNSFARCSIWLRISALASSIASKIEFAAIFASSFYSHAANRLRISRM